MPSESNPTAGRLTEKKLESGAVLGLQIADFEDAIALHDAIAHELIGTKIEGFDLEQMSPADLFTKDLSAFKDAILRVVSSKTVRDTLFACAASCTYQGPRETSPSRITRNTFQSEGARADFYPVAGEVAVLNLAPFFKSLRLPSWIQKPPPAPPPSGSPKSETG
jgi:hypothetical protein